MLFFTCPPTCLLYCTKFTGTKKPLSSGFKLCGEVTSLHQVFGNKITCGVLVFMPIK